MRFQLPAGAAYILQTLEAAGWEACLVGGCVRDLLRGTEPQDWDICTSASPEQTLSCFRTRGQRVLETGIQHGTVTVFAEGEAFEVTTYRTEGPYSDSRHPDFVHFVPELELDLARRDFTMNAIAIDLAGKLRDPFGGSEDIRRGVIRCAGDPERRFREDGLRIMRALRFAASLGYTIEEQTAKALRRCRAMLKQVSAERINRELCRLITGPGAGAVLREYPEVLWEFWPQLETLRHRERSGLNGWERTVRAVEEVTIEAPLKLAALLHDVGGSGCQSAAPEESAGTADVMLRSLRFGNASRKRIVTLIEHYYAPLSLREEELRRPLSRLEPEAFYQLLELRRADIAAQPQGLSEARLEELEQIRSMAERIIAEGQCLTLGDLEINGRDVIAAGIPSGPEVGRILNALLDRVLSGYVPNEREALLKMLPQIPCPAMGGEGREGSALALPPRGLNPLGTRNF